MRGVMRRPVFVLGLLAVLLAPVLALPRSVEACTGVRLDRNGTKALENLIAHARGNSA